MENINITLTPTEKKELETFFQFQLDEEAKHLAAFTAKDSTNKNAYIEKYARHLADPTINMQTIWVNNIIAGSLAKFVWEATLRLLIGLIKNSGDKALLKPH